MFWTNDTITSGMIQNLREEQTSIERATEKPSMVNCTSLHPLQGATGGSACKSQCQLLLTNEECNYPFTKLIQFIQHGFQFKTNLFELI